MDTRRGMRTPATMNESQDQKDVTTGDLVIEIADSDTPEASTSEKPQGDTSTADETLNAQAKKETVLSDGEAHILRELEKQVSNSVDLGSEIDYKTFKKILRVKDSFFGERYFKLFDTNKSETIEVSELLASLRKLTQANSTEKLNFLFQVYDQNGDGFIDIEELRTALRSCMVESSVKLGEEELDMLTQALFEEADEDNSGQITIDELSAVIQKNPGVKENLSVGVEQWLKPPTKAKKKGNRHLTKAYFLNNLRKISFFAILMLLNCILFAVGCWNYRTSNWCIIVARGCGLCLNFDCTFIVVLMLRKCITWLRATPVGHLLPLDQHIMFHKLTGILIMLFTILHTGMHIGNAIMVAESQYNLTVPAFIFTTQADIGWVAGFAPLSGVLLVVVFVIMFICSMPFVRRSGCFEVFYWTHMLYIPFWVLLILHCRYFWMWFIVPGLMFLLEKLFRSKMIKRVRYGNSFILEVNLLPSEVTHLVISKPPNMRFQPGDYLFIQIPDIASSEWHPFTISSAPELEDRLWLHVRSAGHWTKKLYEYFNTYEAKKTTQHKAHVNKAFDKATSDAHRNVDTTVSIRSVQLITDFAKSRKFKKSYKSRKSTYKRKAETHKVVNVQCYIDGPYGTSSREIFETEHAVLIGSGIGVTPYASILQSIMYRFKAYKRCCPSCTHSWYDEVPPHVMNLKKVDFIWINRDQKSFEWFVSLLTQLEMEQTMEGGLGNMIEMHMYMTAALNKTDLKGIGLQMALDLIHKKQDKDLLTGLKTRTQPGRPNFRKLFAKIAAEKKGNVKVFFCGHPMLGKSIKQHCEAFGFSFCKENF
ncbi:NADPH oxidase 5-like isoform X1 [Haliotis rufescens]|uniref:NADPH oxidase 5-like isoform X1 n=2 Tax=Haliotis rufescens TaxID=6454 RepID=UPI00201EF4C9|nr:NADPH oxidase 5-like isoform X1 [Haliotis rufescens]